ncbi:MAG: AMP-binding protein [Proteobacteria bacterium]|nr:AMP-binding protein [Pseudomonadota bacterium]MBU4009383.1 AMP-binding protein [Pseudomonadota bacterium]MBU4036581.1 AMP-binding protein [Pseudomonadota bacterium]
MILENWIHNRIKNSFNKNYSRKQFGQSPNCLTRKDIEQYQLDRLIKTLCYAADNSVFYKPLKDKIAKIDSLESIRHLPFTEPDDLRNSPYKLLCVSLGKIDRIYSHFTTGTTGKPKKIFFAQQDADAIIESMAAIMHTVISDGNDQFCFDGCRVQIFLPDNAPPLSMAGMIAKGVKNLNGIPLIGQCDSPTRPQIESIKAFKPDMIMGSAFRIWRITKESESVFDLADIGVKFVFITSEYLSPAMRKALEKAWNAKVYHHYGMTEPGFAIGIECTAHQGYHFNECDLYFEIVDFKTGEPINNEEEEGELVFTTLNRIGMPLIRYRTGDLARLIRSPCECGACTLLRIGEIPRRKALMVNIGEDDKIYTSLFDDRLYAIPELIDYRIFITRKDGRNHIKCCVEVLKNPDDLTARIIGCINSVPSVKKNMEEGLMGNPEIQFVEAGILRRGGRQQKRRIVDKRYGNR